MTRKDYRLIASALTKCKPTKNVRPRQLYQWILTIRSLCAALNKDNDRFDEYKFIQACYGKDTNA